MYMCIYVFIINIHIYEHIFIVKVLLLWRTLTNALPL